MKKDTRIIIGICLMFLLAAGFLFVRQQERISGAADGIVSVREQEIAVKSSSDVGTSQVLEEKEESRTAEECAVYVSGAVKHPGLYRYHGTARVSDAIEAAGGFKNSADTEAVNLARVLTDGEQICVLTKKESARQKKSEKNSSTPDEKDQETDLININKASLEELMSLPGIGQAKAALIIEYRTNQGNFSKKEDLMNISGIKEGVYNKVKDFISV